jgi:hypothetical protein
MFYWRRVSFKNENTMSSELLSLVLRRGVPFLMTSEPFRTTRKETTELSMEKLEYMRSKKRIIITLKLDVAL